MCPYRARFLSLRYARQQARLGFTLIELAVTVCVIAILSSVLLERVMFYRDQAERAAMAQVVGNLRSALHLQLALLLVRNREYELIRLAQENPMQWLAEKPANYLGELEAPDPEQLNKGNWYYDKRDKRLVYLIAGATGKNESNRVYLNVNLLRGKPDSRTTFNGAIEGVVLQQSGP